jgi:hypothetical protein
MPACKDVASLHCSRQCHCLGKVPQLFTTLPIYQSRATGPPTRSQKGSWAPKQTERNTNQSETSTPKEEEGLQGVFKRLRRNGHQLEKGLQMAQRGPSLK